MTESTKACETGFCGIGKWAGTAEVYDGQGKFLSNAADQRHVRTAQNDGRVKIDLAFIGPLKFSGHYFIREEEHKRFYEGPINVGLGEAFIPNLVVSEGYWAVTGLSQQFFLMIMPEKNVQLSLSLMSRGQELIYSIVSENHRVDADENQVPGLLSGTSYDLSEEANAGRAESYIARDGSWVGTVTCLDENLKLLEETPYQESVTIDHNVLASHREGGLFGQKSDNSISLYQKPNQLFSGEGNVVGSASIMGGRACSGAFHYLRDGLRVWRREVVNHAGTNKALVEIWYQGTKRVGAQFASLEYKKT